MSFLEDAVRTVLGVAGRAGAGPTSPLVEPVERFVAEIGEVVVGLAGSVQGRAASDPRDLERDVALEALAVAAAVVDADGRHGDAEVAGLAAAFAGRFGPGATSALAGRSEWVDRPSTLLEILVGHDARDGTRTAWRYYELAMRIAHAAAALDDLPTADELAVIDRLRTTLLGAVQRATKPSGPAPQATAAVTGAEPEGARPVDPDALPPARPVEELLAELDGLIGLAPVKAEVRRVADLLRIAQLREQRKLPTIRPSRHLVFVGGPGTGKTTVARLVAQLYRSLGVVSKGHLVETDRSGLVAGYVGQTAAKVKAVVATALGGVLLVDEAYSLARGGAGDFGGEAVDALVKSMEDHRDDLVVIVAGYPGPMAELIASNPGLESRFPTTIPFPDYTDDELVHIFEALCAQSSYRPTPEALAAVRARIDAEPRDEGFGNARFVRNVFEAAVARQASRLVAAGGQPSDEALQALEAADVAGA